MKKLNRLIARALDLNAEVALSTENGHLVFDVTVWINGDFARFEFSADAPDGKELARFEKELQALEKAADGEVAVHQQWANSRYDDQFGF